MMEKYCVNCKWFDDIGWCHKRGDTIDPVYGTRRYAYRDGEDSKLSSYAEDASSVRKSHCKGAWFEPSRWARLKEWVKGLF